MNRPPGVDRYAKVWKPNRVVTFGGLLALSWLVMTTTHEVGHVVGGWIGGAQLIDLELAPWRLPHSLHQPDPHPQLTLWAGPLLGVFLPALVAAITQLRSVWFIADFCLLANGLYLALAWLSGDPHLDTPRMLAAGVPPPAIAAYCLVTIGVGYVRFRKDCVSILSRANSED